MTVTGDLRACAVGPVAVPDSPAVEARTAGGRIWRRAWAMPERLVLEFVGTAVLEATDDGAVTVDRVLPRDLAEHLLVDHVLPLILARQGEVVLHGAVLGRDGRAVVLMGPSGAGKSTVSAYAWRQGWLLAGDDGAVLRFEEGRARVAATSPTLRLTPKAVALLGLEECDSTTAVGKRRLRTVARHRDPEHGIENLALVAVLEPASHGQTAAFDALTGVDAHAALFGCAFYADLARGKVLRDLVDRLVTVAEAVTVGRLVVPRGLHGLAAAEELLRRELTR